MSNYSNEQDPFLPTSETERTDWDLPVVDWVSNSEPPKFDKFGEGLGDFDLQFELETLDYFRDSTHLEEVHRDSLVENCRTRILWYAENFADVEEKGTITRKFLAGLEAPHGFHDPEDLICARQVISYGVDLPVIEDFNEYLERHASMDPGSPFTLARLKVATDPEVIRSIVYKDLAPRFDWGSIK